MADETAVAESQDDDFALAPAPDWLEDFVSENEAGPDTGDGWTDWLSDTPEEELEPEAIADDEEDLPDWLQDEFDATPPDSPPLNEIETLAEIDDELPDLPDWLRGAVDAEAPSAADKSDLPDWLDQASDVSDAAFALDAAATADDDLPDWMAADGATDDDWSASPTPSAADDAADDWLAGAPDDAADLPDWLAETETDLPSSDDDAWLVEKDAPADLPDWLSEETIAPPSRDHLVAEMALAEEDEDDWLTAPLLAADSDDLPNWFTSEDEDIF
jgi:hypothetical protein